MPKTSDQAILDELRKGARSARDWPARRDSLLADARLLDPPISTAVLAEACGVHFTAITQRLRHEEARRGLPRGALGDGRAPRSSPVKP